MESVNTGAPEEQTAVDTGADLSMQKSANPSDEVNMGASESPKQTESPKQDESPKQSESAPTEQSAPAKQNDGAKQGANAEPKDNKPAKADKSQKKADKAKGKADKKAQAEEKKEEAKLKKEWEDSIVASKRVKREEIRRKFKQATVILLVFSLVVTSVVYIMLLFTQENNVRITANSKDQDTSISLSMDNNMWTPYINAKGPEQIWDLSYNPVYHREKIDTVDEVREKLSASEVLVGEQNGDKFIRFTFMVKNTGKYEANLNYEMTLDYDRRGLQNAVRVMWGESHKNPTGEDTVDVKIYASRSSNPRLNGTQANYGINPEDGYIEFVAYPWGSDDGSFDMLEYEKTLSSPSAYDEARANGYFATTPFISDSYVFQEHTTLAQGDIMYCYVCIWVEGSDFDCVDSALGGYVMLGINFTAY